MLNACAVGASGAIFALIVVETHFSGAQVRARLGSLTALQQWEPVSGMQKT